MKAVILISMLVMFAANVIMFSLALWWRRRALAEQEHARYWRNAWGSTQVGVDIDRKGRTVLTEHVWRRKDGGQ